MIIVNGLSPMLGLSSASLPSPIMAGNCSGTERLADPMEARLLTVQGDGFMGGGSSNPPANPLESLFIGGNPPSNASTVLQVAEHYGLVDGLKGGIVPVWIRNVAGSPMQQLNTLSAIPAAITDLIEVATDVDRWAEWMPRFKKSQGIPAQRPGAITHEVLMDGGASDFHYQARMEYGAVEGGFQIRWWIQPLPGFQADRKAKGLRINNGSWTFSTVPGSKGETLMAYQIHVEADVNSLLLKIFKPIIMGITLGEFDKIISAIANRSAERTWTRDCGRNPSGRNYRMRKV